MIKICILTVSDTRIKESDESGNKIQAFFSRKDCKILQRDIVKDAKELIQKKIVYYIDELQTDIVFTTGGTGFSSRDVTPEATKEIVEKEVPGISEFLRAQGLKKTNRAILSRGISGIRKTSLIVNLPGSPSGVLDSLEALQEILPHAVEMLKNIGH